MPPAEKLPLTGKFRYESGTGIRRARHKKGKKPAFEDDRGNHWEWGQCFVPPRCEHWDVQHEQCKAGFYSRITTDGRVHHGTAHEECFPK